MDATPRGPGALPGAAKCFHGCGARRSLRDVSGARAEATACAVGNAAANQRMNSTLRAQCGRNASTIPVQYQHVTSTLRVHYRVSANTRPGKYQHNASAVPMQHQAQIWIESSAINAGVREGAESRTCLRHQRSSTCGALRAHFGPPFGTLPGDPPELSARTTPGADPRRCPTPRRPPWGIGDVCTCPISRGTLNQGRGLPTERPPDLPPTPPATDGAPERPRRGERSREETAVRCREGGALRWHGKWHTT